MLNGSSKGGMHPLLSLLTNHRDENKHQQQSTLHSILTSTTARIQSPASARRTNLFVSLIQLTSACSLAVFLSPSSSASNTTTSVRIDCNIKTETMDGLTTKTQQQTAAITRAFDNLAKAAAHVRCSLVCRSVEASCTRRSRLDAMQLPVHYAVCDNSIY